MYYLYKYETTDQDSKCAENTHYEIKNLRPWLFRLSLPNEKCCLKEKVLRAYFSIITFGNFRIYYAVSVSGEIMHTSFVVGKCHKFPFLCKGEYQIGPCITKKEYRGKGIYPNVLRKIIHENGGGVRYYMFCHDSNTSSIKGIIKAGFKEDGLLEKKKFKIYERK